MDTFQLVEVNKANLNNEGCYCCRSKNTSLGYRNKNEWLESNFDKGLTYVKIMEGGKPAGFIEYVPIESSSRVVYGENYMVIHCLWVQVAGKGYASALISRCLDDARALGMDGVIVLTNPDTSWTPGKAVFLKNGFIEVAQAPYQFELLVYAFRQAREPYFPNDWEKRLAPYDQLSILRTWQCPFIDAASQNMAEAAKKLDMPVNIVELTTREQLLRLAPTPYGVYGVVFNRQLVAFHRLTVHSAFKRLNMLQKSK